MTSESLDLASGDVALITGGASGIGRAFAEAAIDRGLQVVLADIDVDRLDATAKTLRADGGTVRTCRVDLTDEASIVEAAAAAHEFGPLRLACLNAGVTSSGRTTWMTPPEIYDSVVGVNLGGLFNSIRAIVPGLVAQQQSSGIVITASMAGLVASAYSGVYAASKAGAVALGLALRDELGGEAPQVRVTLLAPGVVKTDLMKTSVQVVGENALDASLADVAHDALNSAGAEPRDVVEEALQALDQERFWALPPEDDGFSAMLQSQLDELAEARRS